VRTLKEEFAGELEVPGSHRLVQELIESDLADQINLMIFPVILGTGLRARRLIHTPPRVHRTFILRLQIRVVRVASMLRATTGRSHASESP
jgi:riboflavin biosynthesis pyrimidine reductase